MGNTGNAKLRPDKLQLESVKRLAQKMQNYPVPVRLWGQRWSLSLGQLTNLERDTIADLGRTEHLFKQVISRNSHDNGNKRFLEKNGKNVDSAPLGLCAWTGPHTYRLIM